MPPCADKTAAAATRANLFSSSASALLFLLVSRGQTEADSYQFFSTTQRKILESQGKPPETFHWQVSKVEGQVSDWFQLFIVSRPLWGTWLVIIPLFFWGCFFKLRPLWSASPDTQRSLVTATSLFMKATLGKLPSYLWVWISHKCGAQDGASAKIHCWWLSL